MLGGSLKRFVACAVVLGCAVPAFASLPTGARFGAWHVTSIGSLSGAGAGDASAGLGQSSGEDSVELNWSEDTVTVSIHFEGCNGDEEFDPSYGVSTARWLAEGDDALFRRVERDLQTWTEQAELSCASRRNVRWIAFEHLRPALDDFTARVREFAPYQKPSD